MPVRRFVRSLSLSLLCVARFSEPARRYNNDTVYGPRSLDLTKDQAPMLDTDMPRLRAGKVGAQFWSVYVSCTVMQYRDAVRATMEQIDVTKKVTLVRHMHRAAGVVTNLFFFLVAHKRRRTV